MTVREALSYLKNQLHPSLGSFAQPQSEEIIEHILNCSRSQLFLSSRISLSDSQVSLMESILLRRLSGEPLAYILGKTYFYSREFAVTPDTLIPRPDTEILVEQVLIHERNNFCCFADIGIGSGIISCILTEQHTDWTAVGIDISCETLKIAKKNRITPVHLLCCDLLSAIKPEPIFDFIVSNPPYISSHEMNVLDSEVKDHEPYLALYGGKDGLDFYIRLAKTAKKVLKKKGRIYCEIGYSQQNQVNEIFNDFGWTNLNFTKDLSGHPRVIHATLSE